jgi:PilZ domain
MSRKTVIRSETPIARPTLKARMRAVTPSGAYLLANRKLRVGSRLRLSIKGEPVTLRVTRCATQPTGGWALMCAFETQPGKETLRALNPAQSALDQRQWMRLPCSTLAKFRSASQQGHDITWAQLLDISAHGACLITKPPMSKGDVLELELGASKPIHATGRVTYARQQLSGAWTVGCHLEHELAQDELWKLVSDAP